MKRIIYVFLLIFLLASFFYNIFFDFHYLALGMHLISLAGLLTVWRPYFKGDSKAGE